MMNKISRLEDVFTIHGQPTVTYVSREKGKFEFQLQQALDSKGLLCLLTGSSKTGKTTLYTKVINSKKLDPLIVRCTNELTAKEFWKIALEEVNFDSIVEETNSKSSNKLINGKVSGKMGLAWLSSLTGEVSTEISSASEKAQIKKKLLSEPSPKHLIPILKKGLTQITKSYPL